MHRYHPDPDRGDNPNALLWDDCERCADQSQLRSLDQTKLRKAVLLTIHVERGGHLGYHSEAEKELCSRIHWAMLAFERLGLMPELYENTLHLWTKTSVFLDSLKVAAGSQGAES